MKNKLVKIKEVSMVLSNIDYFIYNINNVFNI